MDADLSHGPEYLEPLVAATEHADVVPRYYGQLAEYHSRGFVALNTALAADGAYLYIPDGTVVERSSSIT